MLIKRYFVVLPLFLSLLIPAPCASGQQGSTSSANEIKKLQIALGNALDRLDQLGTQLTAAQAAIAALQDERKAAQDALIAAERERESLERQVKLAETAIEAQQKVVAIYEQAIELQTMLLDRHEKRIDALETKLDKANTRTVKAGVIGFIAGVASALFKVF